MVIRLVYFSVLWLNNKPNTFGTSQVHSPREISTKLKLYCEKHCKAGFGDLLQASYDRDITNRVGNMRTYEGIYLGPMKKLSVWHKEIFTYREGDTVYI